MEQVQTNNFLETEKVGKLMRQYAIPCIISLLVGALYNIVDQIFIANADYLGSYGNAANTVVFPMTVLALGIAVMIGDGCCAFVSISFGKKEEKTANRSVGNAILLCIICSVILMAAYLIFSEPILAMFGGKVNEETYAMAKEYFFIISLGIPFYMFGQAMNPIIRADGNPRFAMISTVAGAITNVILDPIMIYGLFGCPKMGMSGAALATVLGQVLTSVLCIWYLCHTRILKLDKKCFGLWGGLMKKFLILGLTSLLAQISLVISMAAVQNMCTKYGAMDAVFGLPEYSQIPLAVLGIVMKFFQIAISVSIGMAAGCIPVIGFNMGAGRTDRVKQLFKLLIILELVVGGVALFIVEVFPVQLINIFGAANESDYYTSFAVKCFRTYLCLLPLSTLNKGTFIFLQGMGKALESTIITLTREIVMGVALPILLPLIWKLDGILYSFPLADFLTFVIAFIVIARTMRELTDETAEERKLNLDTVNDMC